MRKNATPRIAWTDLILVALATMVLVLLGLLPVVDSATDFSTLSHATANGQSAGSATDIIAARGCGFQPQSITAAGTGEPMPSRDELVSNWQREVEQFYERSSQDNETETAFVPTETTTKSISNPENPLSIPLTSDVQSAPSEAIAIHPPIHYLIAASCSVIVTVIFFIWASFFPKIKLQKMPVSLQDSGVQPATNSLRNTEPFMLAFPANWVRVHQPWAVRLRSICQTALVLTALALVLVA